MYQRGGNRGWHHGHHQGDNPAFRKPYCRPYRGAYRDHRGQGNYPYHDRQYNDNEYVEYPETIYRDFHEEDRNYKEYRGHEEPTYQRGGRHNSGNNKFSGYRGGYQEGRGEPSHYHNKPSKPHYKKYDCKPAKIHKKENEVQVTTTTPKALQTDIQGTPGSSRVSRDQTRQEGLFDATAAKRSENTSVVSHNSGPTLLTLTTGSSENESESKSPPQDTAKIAQVCEKPSHESTKAAQVCEKSSQESTKAAQVCEKSSQESTKAAQVCENSSQESAIVIQVYKKFSKESAKAAQVYDKPSQDSAKTSQICEKPSRERVKAEQVCEEHSQESSKVAQVCKKPSQENTKCVQVCEKSSQECAKKFNVKTERVDQEYDQQKERAQKAHPACDTKTEVVMKIKEEELYTTSVNIRQDIVAAEERPHQKEIPMRVNKGKRTHSEERDFVVNEIQKDAENCVGKRMCRSQDHYMDENYMEEAVQIPLLGEFLDMPPETVDPAGTSEQENSLRAVECRLTGTAQELRTSVILGRKEEIELAFAQDCKTFACVASTLLKKDPSIEASVTNALRSSLQEVAGRCVQELSSFIENYDKVLIDTSNRLQD